MIAHIYKEVQLGCQFPVDIMTGDFTSRASSDTSDLAIEKRVKGFQKYFINVIMREIYNPLLIMNGFSQEEINESNLSVSFGTSNIIDLLVTDIVSLSGTGTLSQVEADNG